MSVVPTPLPLPDPMLRMGRIALRPWVPGDATFLSAVGVDDHLQRFIIGWPTPYTVDVAEAWIAGHAEARDRGERLDLAVIDPVSGRPIGAAGLSAFSPVHRRAQMGYWTAPGERRRGVASQAVRMLARWAFDELELERIQILVEPVNMPSIRVVETIGAQQEGMLRDHLRVAGMRRDVLVYGLLPDELLG